MEWSFSDQVDLLNLVCDYKPAGPNKNAHVAKIVSELNARPGAFQVSDHQVWKKLQTWYNLPLLDNIEIQRTDSDMLSLPEPLEPKLTRSSVLNRRRLRHKLTDQDLNTKTESAKITCKFNDLTLHNPGGTPIKKERDHPDSVLDSVLDSSSSANNSDADILDDKETRKNIATYPRPIPKKSRSELPIVQRENKKLGRSTGKREEDQTSSLGQTPKRKRASVSNSTPSSASKRRTRGGLADRDTTSRLPEPMAVQTHVEPEPNENATIANDQSATATGGSLATFKSRRGFKRTRAVIPLVRRSSRKK